MTIYLIDYENVHDIGMRNSEKVPEDSKILLFFSNNEDKITMGNLMPIVSRLTLYRTRAGKQSLDMHLASYLGHEIGINGKDHKYVIVSKDHDYDNVTLYWKDQGIDVSVQGALVPELPEQAGDKKEAASSRKVRQTRRQNTRFASRNDNRENTPAQQAQQGQNQLQQSPAQQDRQPPQTAVTETEPMQTAVTETEPKQTDLVLPAASVLIQAEAEPSADGASADEPDAERPEPVTGGTEDKNRKDKKNTAETVKTDISAAEKSESGKAESEKTGPAAAEQEPVGNTDAGNRPANSRQPRNRRMRRKTAAESRRIVTDGTENPESPEKPEEAAQTGETKQKNGIQQQTEKTLLNNKMMTKLTEAKLDAATVGKLTAAVMKQFGKKNFKQIVYREIIKTCGMQQGLEVYGLVKKIL